MKPYFEQGGVRIFLGRWEEVWPTLGLKHEDVNLLWADPPYGVRAVQVRSGRRAGGSSANRGTTAREWAPIEGDCEPFNPAPLLAFPRAVLWGANHYASRLPDSPSWWFWHKRPGMDEGVDFADGEAAWTNLGGQFRYIPLPWMGLFALQRTAPKCFTPHRSP